MKTVELVDVPARLAEFARGAAAEPMIVVDQGKPVAAIVGIDNADLETVNLSTNPTFLALIERSRGRQEQQGGISAREMRRRLAMGPGASRPDDASPD